MKITFDIRSALGGVATDLNVYKDGEVAGLLYAHTSVGKDHPDWEWSLILVNGGSTGRRWVGLAAAMQGTVDHIRGREARKAG